MHLDPNSLFEEIGLHEEMTFQKPHRVITTLEIQVAEHQICQLQVRQFDDPYLLALNFCTKHQLNQIAVDVIQQRIQQIFNKEKSKQIKIKRESSKSEIKNKDTKKKPKLTKDGVEIGVRLYQKGIKSMNKATQNRIKYKMEKQAEDERQLTFKPKINEVSEKIVEVRKMIGGNPIRPKTTNIKKLNEELEECTFKPAINKVSQKIMQERHGRNQQQIVQKLYYDSVRMAAKKKRAEKIQQFTYKPTINQKSRIQVRDTFMERLERENKNKKQKEQILRSVAEYQHCSFTPEIGRPPKITRNKENLPIGDYLISKSQQMRSKSEIHYQSSSIGESTATNKNSQIIYQNLVKRRIQFLFEVMDGDRDGFISPDNIDLQQLQTETLLLLQPFFTEMEEMNATLDQRAFHKAIVKLLDVSSCHLKGKFLSGSKKVEDKKFSFKPKLNYKSHQLAQQRSAVDLYEQGIIAKRKKQVYTALLQAKKQEEQLQQCTFKPLLNSTSQVYVRKHIFKGNNPDDSLERYMYSSQNEQI